MRQITQVGAKFQEAVQKSPFSMSQLGKYAGMSDSYVSNCIARGQIDSDAFQKLCDLLGIKPDKVIEQPTPEQRDKDYQREMIELMNSVIQQTEDLTKKMVTLSQMIRLNTEETKNTQDEIHRSAIEQKQWQDKVFNLLKYGQTVGGQKK